MIELKTGSVKINEIIERPWGYYRVLEWQNNYVLNCKSKLNTFTKVY